MSLKTIVIYCKTFGIRVRFFPLLTDRYGFETNINVVRFTRQLFST